MDKIDEFKSKPFEVRSLAGPSVSNVISLMTTGQRFDFDHKFRKTLDSLILNDRASTGFHLFSYATYFPSVIRMFMKIPSKNSAQFRLFFNFLPNHIEKVVAERKAIVDSMEDHELNHESDNFIDVYLKHMKTLETKANLDDNEKHYFTGTIYM